MLLDFGLGIISSIMVSRIFDIPLSWWFVLLGIGFAIIVDLDFLVYQIRAGDPKMAYQHRELLHYPLLYIPLGTLMLWFFSVPYAMLFIFSSLFHFLHDSIGIGWGVQWLYPFNTDHYNFFYRYSAPSKPPLPFKAFRIWKHYELPALAEKHGDPDWIKNIYFKWHPYAIAELLGFLIALAVLYMVVK